MVTACLGLVLFLTVVVEGRKLVEKNTVNGVGDNVLDRNFAGDLVVLDEISLR